MIEYYRAPRSNDSGLDEFLLDKSAPSYAMDDVGATMSSMFQKKLLPIEPTHRRCILKLASSATGHTYQTSFFLASLFFIPAQLVRGCYRQRPSTPLLAKIQLIYTTVGGAGTHIYKHDVLQLSSSKRKVGQLTRIAVCANVQLL